MNGKSFFKSTSFKCIIALLCVLLVSGIFLTVMNSLLAVTDQEKFERAISKIYGKSVKTETVAVTAQYNDGATVEEAYQIKDDGNYLIKSTGKGGFDNGTVTCWVVVVVKNGTVAGVDKVVIDSNKSQSYIGNINAAFLNGFKENYVAGVPYNVNVGFVKTGATMSGGAICRAVNGAIDFVNAMFGNVVTDIYKDKNFAYLDVISTRDTSHSISGNAVTYNIKTSGYGMASEFTIQITVADGTITAYNVVVNGSTGGYEADMDPAIAGGTWFVGKNAEAILNAMGGSVAYSNINGGLSSNGLKTGATQSSYQCIYAAAFATANYQLCMELKDELAGGEENE